MQRRRQDPSNKRLSADFAALNKAKLTDGSGSTTYFESRVRIAKIAQRFSGRVALSVACHVTGGRGRFQQRCHRIRARRNARNMADAAAHRHADRELSGHGFRCDRRSLLCATGLDRIAKAEVESDAASKSNFAAVQALACRFFWPRPRYFLVPITAVRRLPAIRMA